MLDKRKKPPLGRMALVVLSLLPNILGAAVAEHNKPQLGPRGVLINLINEPWGKCNV